MTATLTMHEHLPTRCATVVTTASAHKKRRPAAGERASSIATFPLPCFRAWEGRVSVEHRERPSVKQLGSDTNSRSWWARPGRARDKASLLHAPGPSQLRSIWCEPCSLAAGNPGRQPARLARGCCPTAPNALTRCAAPRKAAPSPGRRHTTTRNAKCRTL